MKNARRYFEVMVVLILFFTSCSKSKTSTDCTPCTSAVSFKSDIIPIFQANCAVQGCHDAITHAAAVILDSASAYHTVTEAGTGYVTPNNANASILYTTLNAGGVNGMPKGLPPLPECQVQSIACWINQGALNN